MDRFRTKTETLKKFDKLIDFEGENMQYASPNNHKKLNFRTPKGVEVEMAQKNKKIIFCD